MDDKYKYNSVVVARYIIAFANENNFFINMTKLQKLLYIAYGVYIAIKNERLTNEHPQAWPYGPVFPTTRNKLLRVDFSTICISDKSLDEINKDTEIQSLIKLVFDGFGNKNATTLTVWSHQIGSPWDKVVNSNGFSWGDRIPDQYIQEYFNSILIKNGK